MHEQQQCAPVMTSGARYSSVPTKLLARPSGCATSSACWPEGSAAAASPPRSPLDPAQLMPLLVRPAAAAGAACSAGSMSREGVVLPWQ